MTGGHSENSLQAGKLNQTALTKANCRQYALDDAAEAQMEATFPPNEDGCYNAVTCWPALQSRQAPSCS